jgi:hypothetical protein
MFLGQILTIIMRGFIMRKTLFLILISLLLTIGFVTLSNAITTINPTISFMFKAPEPGLHSIAVNNKYLWISTWDKMFRLDPNNGSVIKQININERGGLELIGDYLYAIDHDKINKMNPESGVILSSLPLKFYITHPSSLAYDGYFFWVGESIYEDGGKCGIYKVDPIDGSIVQKLNFPCVISSGLAHDGKYLWIATSGTPSMIYKVDPKDGSIISQFESPGNSSAGLDFDDEYYLWTVINTTPVHNFPGGNIYKMDVGVKPDPFTVSGVINKDTTWSGTVNVLGDVTVPEGITLTVEPGTIVRFAARWDKESSGNPVLTEFVIKGALIAKGTADKMITFTSELTENPVPGDWSGIGFSNPNMDSIIDYCVIEYGGGIWGSTPDVTNSIIRKSSGNGIYLTRDKSKIIGNTITDNGAGMYICVNGPTIIDRNKIIRNGRGIGIHACCMSNLSITNNIITDNTDYGVYISSSGPSLGNVNNADTTDNGGNQIYNNGKYDVYSASAITIKAEGNYWGSNDPKVIDSHIWDDEEGATGDLSGNIVIPGIVDFEPWLSAPGGSLTYFGNETQPKATLSISSVETIPSSQAKVPLSITDASGIASGDIRLKYDSNILSISGIKTTPLTSGMTLITNTSVSGQIKIAMAGASAIPSGSGSLIDISFTVNPNASIGTETVIQLVDTELYDESGKVIPMNFENGIIKIIQLCVKGDVNNDGYVRANDAMMILQFVAELRVPDDYQKCAADFNSDGKIGSNDATLVLRKAVGLLAPSKDLIADRHISISLPEVYGIKGEVITIPIMIDNINILSSGDISISYDSKILHVVEVLPTPDLLMVSNINQSGLIKISFAGTDRLTSNSLGEIKFEVLTDDVSPLTFKVAELYGIDAIPLKTKFINSQFSSWNIKPKQSILLQNYPNPFNPETWIPYQLNDGNEVTIRIHSLTGALIRELRLGHRPAGLYTTQDKSAYWDGKNEAGEQVSSGVYFYNIQAGNYSATKKMIVTK